MKIQRNKYQSECSPFCSEISKDFDLLIFPNARHGFGSDSYYMMRRRWDYFIEHLMNAVPPEEYMLKVEPDPRLRMGE
ncbi:MAG TPA: hypothetical protein VK861_06835 [Bacteroidales bacterium]|nr:hypothetical protein [Bacteroidales bacterium]